MKETYDLVILDYQLGYLNGLDVQDAINKEAPGLPVVFITGQGNERVAVEANVALFLIISGAYFLTTEPHY